MTKKEFNKLYALCRGELQHFIQQDKWPIFVDNKKRRNLLFKHMPALFLNKNNRVELNPKVKINPELLAFFWEQEYNFIAEELMELHEKIDLLRGE